MCARERVSRGSGNVVSVSAQRVRGNLDRSHLKTKTSTLKHRQASIAH